MRHINLETLFLDSRLLHLIFKGDLEQHFLA